MKVYTKTGDSGQTSLLTKERVDKDDVRVDAYGTIDEANAALGLARSLLTIDWAGTIIKDLQVELIALNADMASAVEQEGRITVEHVARLERLIDSLETKRIPQKYFVAPGGTTSSAALDLARTIIRRAERLTVRLKRAQVLNAAVPLYVNRLSDLLFVLARCVEQEELIKEVAAKVLTVLNKEAINLETSKLDKVKKILEAAQDKAKAIGVPMVIAVVDDGGNLIAQHRMDGALLASISIAFDKAYTAVALKMSTDRAAQLVTPGQSLYGLNTANNGKFIVFGGGFPLIQDGVVVGGLGVSGGSVEEDIEVAKAGLAAW